MGIPRLTQDLFDYTEIAVLSGAPSNIKDGEIHIPNVVIDGPSLVYHVYDTLLKNLTSRALSAAIVPTYMDVVKGVQEFIATLRFHHVAM